MVEPKQASRTAADAKVYTRRRLIIAGLTVLTPTALAAAAVGRRPAITASKATRAVAGATGPSVFAAVPTTVAPAITTTPVASPSSSPPRLDQPISFGMNSDRTIEILQDRLRELRFDPGPTDGYFGEATMRAVWAFEKLVLGTRSDAVTGVVTRRVWNALHQPQSVAPRRPGIPGRHLEVYLPEQVAVLFDNGAVALISHISSGAGVEWCDEVTIDNDDGTQSTKAICGVSITPGGVYHFERKIDGWREAALGRLYNPVYFNYGIAIHGATNVPSRPASRGCVRIPMHIAEYFPDLVSIGDWVFVFDGVEQPEHYGAQLPVFDYLDPSATTTSTTSTTTTTTTTTTPTTSLPPTTAAPVPATEHTHPSHQPQPTTAAPVSATEHTHASHPAQPTTTQVAPTSPSTTTQVAPSSPPTTSTTEVAPPDL